MERMAEAAASAKKNGAQRFCIVTSGRGIDCGDELEKIAIGINRVRDVGLSPCATLGTLTGEQLAYLKDAGLDRYHHNIETSSEYFPRICSTHSFNDRLEVLRNARMHGLSVCSGGILGMGESMEDRVKMALTLRELEVDSVPINFLMPIKGTPLENSSALVRLKVFIPGLVSVSPAGKRDPGLRRQRNGTGPASSPDICCGSGRFHDRQLSHYCWIGSLGGSTHDS